MSLKIVGIGDCDTSSDPSDVIVTYALGSCVCVTLHDPVARIGGLLHILLPHSGMDPARAKQNPFLFADTGVPLLFERVYALGARRERIAVNLAGGAQMSLATRVLEVGPKNIRATREALAGTGARILKQAVGGNVARTVRLRVDTGEFILQQSQTDRGKAAAGLVKLA